MDATILDHLTRVVTEHGQEALWFEALPWISTVCGATGGRVFVGLNAAVQHQYGQISDELARAIDDWERSLASLTNWVPTGGGSLASAPPMNTTLVHESLPLIHVAIREKGSVIGGVSLAFDSQEAIGEQLAATTGALIQAVVRVGSLARERHQVTRSLTYIKLFHEVSRAITSSLEIDAVLKDTTGLAADILGAQASSLLLIDHDTKELIFTIPHGESGGTLKEFRMPITEGIAGWVARYGQPVISNDTAHDPRFTHRVDSHSGFQTRNILCVPLQVRGNIIGVLEVLNKNDGADFNDEDLVWLSTLAAQAAIAIENARLYSTLREERDRIIKAEEEVRHQIARDLHDGPAQLMAAIIMNVEIMRKIARKDPAQLNAEFDDLRDLAQRANQEVRQLLFELRPLILESRGLVGALRAMASKKRQSSLAIDLRAESLPPFVNRKNEGAVFMIVQEAVNNVRKHANASRSWLRLRTSNDFLIIEVEDNGLGFNLATVEARYNDRGSLGLLSMKERAEWLDGHLEIESPRPGHSNGTLVTLRVPLDQLTEDTTRPVV